MRARALIRLALGVALCAGLGDVHATPPPACKCQKQFDDYTREKAELRELLDRQAALTQQLRDYPSVDVDGYKRKVDELQELAKDVEAAHSVYRGAALTYRERLNNLPEGEMWAPEERQRVVDQAKALAEEVQEDVNRTQQTYTDGASRRESAVDDANRRIEQGPPKPIDPIGPPVPTDPRFPVDPVGPVDPITRLPRPPSYGIPRPPDAGPADPDALRRYLDEVLSKYPGHPLALKERAVANAEAGDRAAACSDAEGALSGAPGDSHAAGMVKLLCGAGIFDRAALRRLMDAKARRPPPQQDGAAPDGRGPAGAGPGGSPADGARVALLRGSVAPSDSRMLADDAQQALRSGNFRGGLAAARNAIQRDPRDVRNYRLYASAAKALRNYGLTLQGADLGLRLAPNDSALLNLRSYALGRRKDYKGALEAADKALAVNGADATAWANRAWALGGLGDRAGMLDALRKAAALDPRFQESLQSALAGGDSELFFLFPGEQASTPAKASPDRGRNPALVGLAGLAALALFVLWYARSPSRGSEVFEAGTPQQASPAAPGEPGEAPPARLADKYELRGQIGQGGMGLVYEGFDVRLGRRVAIKQMRPELKGIPEDRARFLREAKLISRLSHPYIVSIHDILEQGGELYLIFDYVDGRPLSQILSERGCLPLPDSLRILEQVCEAVGHAHRQNVLHRDLKPANIMVDANGYAKVMDFGLAREVKDTLSKVTQNTIAGTPAYMAPEQHLGPIGPAGDVFALGVCLYEMLCGGTPFDGADPLALKREARFPSARSVVPSLPKGIDVLLSAALAPDPKNRIADPLELLASLKALA